MTIQKTSTLSILRDGNIAAGAGYSTDSQQVAPQICYNATVSSISGQSGSLELDTAQSFVDIQNEIRESVSVKGGIGMFSASAEASYMQSMEDKDYSMSLNYYTYFSNTAAIQLAGAGVGLDALNTIGKSDYSNNATYPYFGLFCGDQYITSYDQGAMLLMGINIQFTSNYQKQQFDAHAGASFGNIFSTSGEIQQIASQYSITGSVVMQAFQIGGDPSQLSYILNKNSNGDYYVLTCSLNNMADCISAASGMLDYAKYNFTTQFSFENNTGLTPLGIGFATYEPIYYIGLTPPPSLVTQQVIEDRITLADDLLENQYYEQKFGELVNGYLVPWDTTSNIYQIIQSLYQRAQSNVEIITSPSNPEAGGLGCFTYPDQCNTITQNINASLTSITADDLSFLNGFAGIQYTYQLDLGAYVYRCGDQQWTGFPYVMGTNILVPPYTFDLNNQSFNYTANFMSNGGGPNTGYFSGTSNNGGLSYNGIAHDQNPPLWNVTYTAVTSAFYFEPYNGTDQVSSMSGVVPAQDIVEV